MEYVYSSPAKRRKISHANDQQMLLNNNEDNMILGSSSGDDGQSHFRKKLLVLDVNGLLVDIVADPPDEAHKPDTRIAQKAVFKRPFCDEFLEFCFQRFSVGVWTSRTRKNINRVLDFLMRDTQRQLLFCWDQSHCTDTGFNTIENSGKPLLLKELKKLWEKQDPNLPWDRGAYDVSNTLLLDDSPYKALRNPPYTAIFPYTYSYLNTQDNDLGPNGDLRNYLERLAASDNVQTFVEQNPFGQQPITHDNESWNFYRNIICSTQPGAGPSRSRKKLIVLDIGGLLVDVRMAPREDFREDTVLGSKAVFKRPYCDEFLQFCFQRFNVGVWTSVFRFNTERAVDYLMRENQHKLLFCWDLSHCTDTGFFTVENNSKKLLLKEIRKLWEKKGPDLPWEIGEYDESNTLLVDTKSHRALLNPPHTAIFPYPYCHWHTEDNSLRDLRIYLERLAASENVQKFVSENSFGQRPIREKNLSWGFYQKIIHAFSYKRKAGDSVKPDPTIASVTKTLLEPEPVSTTTSAAHTLLEPETGTTTALVGQALSEPDLNTTAQTSMEQETITATVLTAHTLAEPQTSTTSALVGQTISEPDLDTAALAAQTSLEQETVTATVLTAPMLLEPEIDTTAPAAQTLLKTETFTSDDDHSGFTTSCKGALTTDVDNVTAGTALSAKIKSPSPKRSEGNIAVNRSVTRSMNKRIVKSVKDVSCVGSDDIHQDSPHVEHKVIVTESNSALDGSVTRSRNKRVVNSVEDNSRGKRFRSSEGSKKNTKVFVLALQKPSGVDDGNSCQKRTRRPRKIVVKKPTGVLEDGHGITTDLDEQQPLSVWYERMRRLSVIKRSDKSRNQTNVITTDGTTSDYQQDWPFIKLCPIWTSIESLVLHPTPPQKPHFSPLKKTNELCREGLAIAHMVTYWNLVQRLSDLKPNDPVDIINNGLEVLADLETHGFDVEAIRGRLNELLYSKSKAGQHEDILKELEKRNYEKLVIEKEMDRLKVEVQKLQEKQKAKEEEIMRLQSNSHPVSTEIND
ncbi:putative FCP1 domain, HAD superfamily protein [Helianthus debilis subsp. tardiflorus]